ncbi:MULTISPECIES: glycoside hydrolase family 32 protein [unclassified Actinomyces]|uniref:glycoside hydrolase family 32 protein n=1 Tax=unclassified Actinomyces TaxID=2609248 RepID=UPI0013A6DBFC|nr:MULTISPECIES: glycoside hydrolase family 32 protein [unclassified Actinomyces]MBW3070269.1 glycoside hydrolase family 32 protein [Actinomyces sp. 594]NDR52663.1 glycoside hydrolase family 32 protein [Actinomyces sp. 565]
MTEDLRAAALEATDRSHATADPDYPVVHLAPPVGRLNDPNGLLVDSGTYHAFYQFSPFHPHRKLVYWGHASSRDLLHWKHHDPAIIPDSYYDLSGAYSGGAVVLEGEELAGAPAGVGYQFFYTGNLKDPVTDERTASQCLVTSTDLQRFDKWPDNPLLPDHPDGYTAHYRDPQVWRDPDVPGSFRMLLGVQREDLTGAALLYRSEDLRSWRLEGELSFPDADGAFDRFGYMWECPGLVRLTDELTGQVRDVLIWCPQGIEPDAEGYENIFPCVYTVGRLEGTELRECDGTFAEVDRGFEFYAPQVFARRPSEPGPVLLTGWAGNASEDDQPSIGTGGWVHALTVPRVLTLRGGRLLQRPAVPLPDDAAVLSAAGERLGGTTSIPELDGHRSWRLRVQADATHRWGLRIGDERCYVTITMESRDGDARLVVDRSHSRYTQHGQVRTVTVPRGTRPCLEVLHDRSVTEVFVGDGEIAFTLRSFVEPTAGGAALIGDQRTLLEEGCAVAYD